MHKCARKNGVGKWDDREGHEQTSRVLERGVRVCGVMMRGGRVEVERRKVKQRMHRRHRMVWWMHDAGVDVWRVIMGMYKASPMCDRRRINDE